MAQFVQNDHAKQLYAAYKSHYAAIGEHGPRDFAAFCDAISPCLAIWDAAIGLWMSGFKVYDTSPVQRLRGDDDLFIRVPRSAWMAFVHTIPPATNNPADTAAEGE
jgi:hypothetical protein